MWQPGPAGAVRMARLLAYLVRRVVLAAVVIFTVAVIAYGMIRALRPEDYPGQALWPSTWHDLDRALLHFDFGEACIVRWVPQLWAAVLIVAISLLADLALAILDPRIRTGGRPPG
jgi:ABC-type antimicrobial peptide transport system permease subunit